MYVEKTRTWDDNWNDWIRYVFFKDEKLKELMLVPEGTSITTFTDKYFIRSSASDEVLTTEKVRIVYYDGEGEMMGSRHVLGHYKMFDIFCSESVERNATNDRLKRRQILIAERLKYLILHNPVRYGLHFYPGDEFDVWTKTIGYTAYHVDFFYITTV